MVNNIQLWFARELDSGDIVVASNATLEKEYVCPICMSKVVPKGTKDNSKVTPHFAHIDKGNCNNETMLHWWFKNKLIEVGDAFNVKEKKVNTYVAKSVSVENLFVLNGIKYNPDLTIETECGKTIHFEMAYTNKKNIEDYIGIWSSLGHTIVEVDIQNLMDMSQQSTYDAIFFNGSMRDKRKRSPYKTNVEDYINRKFKEDRDTSDIERIKRLNWMWTDICRYKDGKLSIEDLVVSVDEVDYEDREFVCEILDKKFCQKISDDIVEHKTKEVARLIQSESIKTDITGNCITVKSLVNRYETFRYIYSDNAVTDVVVAIKKDIREHQLREMLSEEKNKLISILNSSYDDVYLTYESSGKYYRVMPYVTCYGASSCSISCNMVNHYGTVIKYFNVEIKIHMLNEEGRIEISVGDKKIKCNISELCFKRKYIARHFNKWIKSERIDKKAKMWGGLPYETR